ncbi:IS66 family insertion sequence element accessory protein TnpB [Salmonella enterica]|nr:IS66 family insertion sequence element accessory protein TnpB [Salmonella enterica]EHA2750298.1 IS66 family insertion sequence element accessory protein TnpB [Salmonella enterica subsp. enterica serovar Javiana]EEF8564973.1 IS66 family insertion sequence element accessory protein TnpB [Salmonella enterica]EEF9002235.1 IS66 family insertion sequence element accessory protein TnpB [Salmonella enterica]EEF9070109.1 IS66 family insertion sequence element accessory protein TnpB [Salmonella enteri
MITLPTGTRIWIIAGVTDMRCGFNGLASKVQNTLKDDPFSGHIFVFRGRSGKMMKILWADRDGLCLFAKRLERGLLRVASDPRRESASDPRPAVHAAGGDRVATSKTDGTAWHTDITRDKTGE